MTIEELILGQLFILSCVLLLRERPVLVPILLVLSTAMAIVGASTMAISWFIPLGLFCFAYVIYRLYEQWGI